MMFPKPFGWPLRLVIPLREYKMEQPQTLLEYHQRVSKSMCVDKLPLQPWRSKADVFSGQVTLTRPGITAAIKQLRECYVPNKATFRAINRGDCMNFAVDIHQLANWTEQITLVCTANHVWFMFDGLHYDAECPEGVAKWQELPLFQGLHYDYMMLYSFDRNLRF